MPETKLKIGEIRISHYCGGKGVEMGRLLVAKSKR